MAYNSDSAEVVKPWEGEMEKAILLIILFWGDVQTHHPPSLRLWVHYKTITYLVRQDDNTLYSTSVICLGAGTRGTTTSPLTGPSTAVDGDANWCCWPASLSSPSSSIGCSLESSAVADMVPKATPSMRIGIWTEPSGSFFSCWCGGDFGVTVVGEAVGVVAQVVAAVVTARLELEQAGVKLTGEEQGESTFKKSRIKKKLNYRKAKVFLLLK